MGLSHNFPCLLDGGVQAVEKRLVVSPLVSTQALACSFEETSVVFVTILGQEFKTLRRLVLVGDK